MRILENPYRGLGLPASALFFAPRPSVAADRPLALLGHCPAATVTPVLHSRELAEKAGVHTVWVKDERGRMGLGSFKALGAAYVIARDAEKTGAPDLTNALDGRTYVTASAGNHGLSVAAGAHVFGAKAVIYLSETVPEDFSERLKAKGAIVVRAGENYEASMAAAAQAAKDNGWTLLSDSSWEGYFDLPYTLMEGYLVMAAEAVQQLPEAPSHIFLQAGVGGMAGAVAAYARKIWGDAPTIIVVEPEAAPALIDSIVAERAVVTQGPVSAMGRLDCKEPSLIALAGLSHDADFFVTLSEEEAADALPFLLANGLETSASGGAGAVALVTANDQRKALGLNENSTVLLILSEGIEV